MNVFILWFVWLLWWLRFMKWPIVLQLGGSLFHPFALNPQGNTLHKHGRVIQCVLCLLWKISEILMVTLFSSLRTFVGTFPVVMATCSMFWGQKHVTAININLYFSPSSEVGRAPLLNFLKKIKSTIFIRVKIQQKEDEEEKKTMK